MDVIRQDIRKLFKRCRVAVARNIHTIGYVIDAVFIATLGCCLIAFGAAQSPGSTIWQMNSSFSLGAMAVSAFLIGCVAIHIVGIKRTSTTIMVLSATTASFLFVLTFAFLFVPTEVTRSMLHVPMTTAIKGYKSGSFAADFVDDIHKNLHCCGIDSADGKWYVPFRLINNKFVGEQVPESCCKPRVPFTPTWLHASVQDERQSINATHPGLSIPEDIEMDLMNNRQVPEPTATTPKDSPQATQDKTAATMKATEAKALLAKRDPALQDFQNSDRRDVKRRMLQSKRQTGLNVSNPTKPNPLKSDTSDTSDTSTHFDCTMNATWKNSYTIGCYRNAARFFGYYKPSVLAAFSFVLIFELISIGYSVFFCRATWEKWAEEVVEVSQPDLEAQAQSEDEESEDEESEDEV